MWRRRGLLALPLLAAAPEPGGFAAFIEGVKADGARDGVGRDQLAHAFAATGKTSAVDHGVPEGATWDAFRKRALSPERIGRGRTLYRRQLAMLEAVAERHQVPPMPVLGLWGLETGFGPGASAADVIEVLSRVAFSHQQSGVFRAPLLSALKAMDQGPDAMLAGVLTSIASFLAKSGWTDRLPWGIPAERPGGIDEQLTGRRTMDAWIDFGVVPKVLGIPGATNASLLTLGHESFLVFPTNFSALRRIEPTDMRAAGAALLGDRVVA